MNKQTEKRINTAVKQLTEIKGSKSTLKLLKEGIIKAQTEKLEVLNTKLFDAVREGNFKKVKNALKKGANVNAKDNIGKTALMYASDNSNKEMAELLKKHGAKRLAVNI